MISIYVFITIRGDKMLKIDICDDEQLWIDKARDIIGDHFKNKQEVILNFFIDSKSLMNKLFNKKECSDIVILDIDMPEMNGFETAKLIKETYPDILLLFYTVHEQYVFESFQFQPFRYIRKINAQKELDLALSAAMQTLDKRVEKCIVLKTNDEISKVDISQIMYFETEMRKCNVYTTDGKVYCVRKSIKELFGEIGSPDFIMLHNGAAVNIKYIKDYSSYDITMVNNTRLIVSRSHIKSVKKAIMDYWSDRL